MRRSMLAVAVLLGGMVAAGDAMAAGKLEEVTNRGSLNCTAHNGSHPGFAEVDAQGKWKGFDIDMCRVFATAVFGTYENHLNLVPVSWAQRWPLLQSDELDVVIKQSGWTESRDTELGFDMSRPYLFAPFQALTRKDLGAAKVADLDGGTICVPAGSSNERIVANYAAKNDIKLEIVAYDKWEEMVSAFFQNRCDAIISSATTLAVTRMDAKNPDDYVILDDVMSLEAQSWIVKEGDDRWLDIANWAITALFYAEQEGITSKNVEDMRANPPSAEVAKFLGVTPGVGKRLGLSDDWAYNVIKINGNYSEIWDRDIGKDSPFKLERGINALWNAGGLHYPLTFD